MSVAPVRKELHIPVPPEAAFRRFTTGMAAWWPTQTHSVLAGEDSSVFMEQGAGGRMVERGAGGEEAEWGRVTAWLPPLRLTFTWHPGREPEYGQVVDVRFQRTAEGTRLVLVHTGWETLGPAARARRARRVRDRVGPGARALQSDLRRGEWTLISAADGAIWRTSLDAACHPTGSP